MAFLLRSFVLLAALGAAESSSFGSFNHDFQQRLSAPISISCTVQASVVIRVIPNTLFGTNLEWAYNADGISGADGSVTPAWANLVAQMGVATIRFPGGTLSDFYNWQDGIGPESARPAVHDPTDSGTSRNVFGTPDLIRFCAQTNTEALITVNAGTGTAAEAAAWVAYCNQPGNSQRAADGLPNPANVKLWEVGNELYLPGNPTDQAIITVTPEVYAARFLSFAAAMRQVDPTIKVMAIGMANASNVNLPYPDWSETVLQQDASQMDYIAVHNAYFPAVASAPGLTVQQVYQSLWAIPEAVDLSLQDLSALIAQYQTTRQIGIAITEWGPLFSTDPAWIDHEKTLGSAVYLARLIQVFMSQPRVSIANFFLFTDQSFMGWVGFNQVPKVPYYVIELFTKHFGTQLLAASVNGAATYNSVSVGAAGAQTGVPEVTATASLDATGQRLFVNFVNRSWSTVYPVAVNIGTFNAASAVEWSISSPGVTDNNGPDMPSWIPASDYIEPPISNSFRGPIAVTETVISPQASVILPPHSIVTVEFDGPSTAATQP